MERSAQFSANRKYRYTLWRRWDSQKGYVAFVSLNPSIANENRDDPAVRRCINFARDWGYGGLCMINLFAYITPNPIFLETEDNPVGPYNDTYIKSVVDGASIVIAAWGTKGSFLQRDKAVISLIPNKHVLRLTKGGYPAHPLYLPKTLEPIKWEPALKEM